MPLSQKEIRDRAVDFAFRWGSAVREKSESQTFWNEFFDVFGISRRRVAAFEAPVKKLGDKAGSIDLFWKGMLIVTAGTTGYREERTGHLLGSPSGRSCLFSHGAAYKPGCASRHGIHGGVLSAQDPRGERSASTCGRYHGLSDELDPGRGNRYGGHSTGKMYIKGGDYS